MTSSSDAQRLRNKLDKISGILGIIGGLSLAAAYLTHPPSAPPETVSSAA